jgi:hypothetical protein
MKNDDYAQIHILEMLTLFWLFFMSAAFLIQIQVPDAPSVGISADMEFAGQDAVRYGLGTPSVDGDYDSRLAELLAANEFDEACELVQDALANGIEGNCWLAKNSGTSAPHGEIVTPSGRTVTVHTLVGVDENLWTVTLDVWTRGGGD